MRRSSRIQRLLAPLFALAQAAVCQPAPDILEIDVENVVRYFADVADPGKLGSDTNRTTAAATRAFTETLFIGDIVAVNGRPAKGLWTSRQYAMGFSPNPAPGSAIADVTQGTIAECKYEVLNAYGALIGRLADTGLFPHAITGGTGAFLGARGEQLSAPAPAPRAVRLASMSEDPALRRVHGGGTTRIVWRLYPLFRPEIEADAQGLAIYHGEDFSRVTAARPARPGEALVLRARNLGPTTPAVNPGSPFPDRSFAVVNAPVEVIVNGQAVDAHNQIGWPNETNVYRVDFRVPDATPAGMARLQLRAAWMLGSEAGIPVQ